MSNLTSKRLYRTTREAAGLLGVNEDTLLRWIKKYHLTEKQGVFRIPGAGKQGVYRIDWELFDREFVRNGGWRKK